MGFDRETWVKKGTRHVKLTPIWWREDHHEDQEQILKRWPIAAGVARWNTFYLELDALLWPFVFALFVLPHLKKEDEWWP